jgi:hypothetical protein
MSVSAGVGRAGPRSGDGSQPAGGSRSPASEVLAAYEQGLSGDDDQIWERVRAAMSTRSPGCSKLSLLPLAPETVDVAAGVDREPAERGHRRTAVADESVPRKGRLTGAPAAHRAILTEAWRAVAK